MLESTTYGFGKVMLGAFWNTRVFVLQFWSTRTARLLVIDRLLSCGHLRAIIRKALCIKKYRAISVPCLRTNHTLFCTLILGDI